MLKDQFLIEVGLDRERVKAFDNYPFSQRETSSITTV